jgi:hypothetical protein
MSCCPAARRRAIGEIKKNLPLRDGYLLIEYRGKERVKMMQSRTTEALYVFSPGAQKFVDAFDAGMFAAEVEDGQQVFFEVVDE